MSMVTTYIAKRVYKVVAVCEQGRQNENMYSVFFILCFIIPISHGDEIKAHIGTNGSTIYTNSGPTIQEQKQKEQEQSIIIANSIVDRNPALLGNQALQEKMTEWRKNFENQGYSRPQALLLAEQQMIKDGSLDNTSAPSNSYQEVSPRTNVTPCSTKISSSIDEARTKLNRAANETNFESAKNYARHAKSALDDVAMAAMGCKCNMAYSEFDTAASQARRARNASDVDDFVYSLKRSIRSFNSALEALHRCDRTR